MDVLVKNPSQIDLGKKDEITFHLGKDSSVTMLERKPWSTEYTLVELHKVMLGNLEFWQAIPVHDAITMRLWREDVQALQYLLKHNPPPNPYVWNGIGLVGGGGPTGAFVSPESKQERRVMGAMGPEEWEREKQAANQPSPAARLADAKAKVSAVIDGLCAYVVRSARLSGDGFPVGVSSKSLTAWFDILREVVKEIDAVVEADPTKLQGQFRQTRNRGNP